MKTAVAYIRVSSEDQNLGPDAQRHQIQQYASAHGITLLEEFHDHAVSGATPLPDRPSFQALLSFIQRTRIDHVLIAKRDRLARDPLIALLATRSLPKRTSFLSADGIANSDSPADQLLTHILDGMAQYERSLIRQRTKQALYALRHLHNRPAGTLPFGFQRDHDNHLTPNPQEQAIIARIRALHASHHSLRAIVQTLAQENLVSPRSNKPLQLKQVHRIIQSQENPKAA